MDRLCSYKLRPLTAFVSVVVLSWAFMLNLWDDQCQSAYEIVLCVMEAGCDVGNLMDEGLNLECGCVVSLVVDVCHSFGCHKFVLLLWIVILVV